MKTTIPTLSEQMRDGNLFAEQCPSREVLKHVTSRWGVLILVALRQGTHRFSDLRRKMGGVSEKMLAQSLQALEQDGFVNRVSYPVVPPHVEYSLTPLGTEVSEKVAALADEGLHIVKSPIVGTYYESPSPGSPPFVKVGDSVEAGEALCIIEAMKLMNEIESDVSGEVVKKLAANGQPVEYGQPLFAIRQK